MTWTYLEDDDLTSASTLVKESFTPGNLWNNFLGLSFYLLFYYLIRIPLINLAYLTMGIVPIEPTDLLYWVYFTLFFFLFIFGLSLFSEKMRSQTLEFMKSFLTFTQITSRILWITIGLGFAFLFYDFVSFIAYFFMGRGIIYTWDYWSIQLIALLYNIILAIIIYGILKGITYLRDTYSNTTRA
jgi:heme exporter protein D